MNVVGSANNQLSDQKLCQTLEIIEDRIFEGTEFLTATLEVNDDAINVFNSMFTLFVLDNEGML